VDMGVLAAFVAIRAGQRRAAVKAAGLVGMSVAFAGARLDRSPEDATRYRVAESFQFTHETTLGGAMRAC